MPAASRFLSITALATSLLVGCVTQESVNMKSANPSSASTQSTPLVPPARPEISTGHLQTLMQSTPEKFVPILATPETFRAQALLSIIQPDGSITRHGYRLDAEYFYPASTIKAFASVAALIRLHELNQQDNISLTPQTPLAIHPLFSDETYQFEDAFNLNEGKKTIEHEIRRTLLVSSNSAFNHLFEFVGQQRINELANEYGLDQTFYMHRLAEFRSIAENQTSPQIDFHLPKDKIHTVPVRKSSLVFENTLPGTKIGVGFQNADGSITPGPLDFKNKNRASLRDLQDVLIKIACPNVDLGTPPFKLTDADRQILLDALSTYPLNSKSPKYTKEDIGNWYGDAQFIPGLLRIDPDRDNWLVYEKSGQAWATTLENAVIIHKPTGITFALTASIYTNKRNILNTDDYEYKFADAFFEDLGEVVAKSLIKQ
ncbi:hypothetical protein KS4_04150 [Poriferisphaera corsica]|uniref:Beta-lactamase class A catalytic domain-containing protein n=1 Tax=Poriferisphaera corsica TaxID=2528020 RepID=A0A517YQ81_9BACT|nr:serine hydrolase [Poriferisphaera corsica]QDU32383.1 hypothetical protein KS4_04150 [Poriferisphaera corsica]